MWFKKILGLDFENDDIDQMRRTSDGMLRLAIIVNVGVAILNAARGNWAFGIVNLLVIMLLVETIYYTHKGRLDSEQTKKDLLEIRLVFLERNHEQTKVTLASQQEKNKQLANEIFELRQELAKRK